MLKKNKKGVDSVSTLMLILMTLVLIGTTLYVFNREYVNVSTKIEDSRFLDGFYYKENLINFYSSEAITKGIAATEKENPEYKKELASNIKKELLKYKTDGNYIMDELKQVEGQITEDNLLIDGNKLSFEINIKIDNSLTTKGKKTIIASYYYKKRFVKEISSS